MILLAAAHHSILLAGTVPGLVTLVVAPGVIMRLRQVRHAR